MSKSKEFHQYLMSDVFQGIEGLSAKPMFGGYGYYMFGVIFAILDQDQIYFKVGEGNIEEFKKMGSKPFRYKMPNGKEISMSYWELPADILEDKDKLIVWIERSVEESKKSKK